MSRSLLAFSLVAPLAFGACVDVSFPTSIVGPSTGRTPGPTCSPEVLAELAPEELRIHLIDVGQGDAIWIQTPYFSSRELESRNILIDAGSCGGFGPCVGGETIKTYMSNHGVVEGEPLHALVLTHAHEDHYGGARTVAEWLAVEEYVDPGYDADASGFISTRSFVESEVLGFDGDVHVPATGNLTPLYGETTLFGGFVDATLIWAATTPPPGGADEGSDINNTSVAFAIRYGPSQVLLTGDIEDVVEQMLIAANDAGEINLASSVLKVAHHGSAGSSSDAFLKRVFPNPGETNFAVISSGVKTFGGTTLPTQATLDRLMRSGTETADQFSGLLARHVLSTENDDQDKAFGDEHNDDHILIRVLADGRVEACYGF